MPKDKHSIPGPFLTKKEVACRLRRTTRTIDNWVASSILSSPIRPNGGPVLFRRCDIERFESRARRMKFTSRRKANNG